MSRKSNREAWVKHVNDQRESGLSRKMWCEKNNLNVHTFSYWSTRLKKEDTPADPNETEWVALLPSQPCVSENENTGHVSVSIGHALIDFNKNSSIEAFEQVVKVLIKYV